MNDVTITFKPDGATATIDATLFVARSNWIRSAVDDARRTHCHRSLLSYAFGPTTRRIPCVRMAFTTAATWQIYEEHVTTGRDMQSLLRSVDPSESLGRAVASACELLVLCTTLHDSTAEASSCSALLSIVSERCSTTDIRMIVIPTLFKQDFSACPSEGDLVAVRSVLDELLCHDNTAMNTMKDAEHAVELQVQTEARRDAERALKLSTDVAEEVTESVIRISYLLKVVENSKMHQRYLNEIAVLTQANKDLRDELLTSHTDGLQHLEALRAKYSSQVSDLHAKVAQGLRDRKEIIAIEDQQRQNLEAIQTALEGSVEAARGDQTMTDQSGLLGPLVASGVSAPSPDGAHTAVGDAIAASREHQATTDMSNSAGIRKRARPQDLSLGASKRACTSLDLQAPTDLPQERSTSIVSLSSTGSSSNASSFALEVYPDGDQPPANQS